jgi:Skp family chaperone for outer membrane proteins
VLAVAEKVAKDKGVDIVLAKEDYQWPARSANELAIIMRTSKVLYSAVELDITDAVLSAWNAEK